MELKNGATTRENFYFSWSESSVTATLNGKLYTNKSVIKTAGNHVFIISDNVGNTAYYNIILDNVPPTFTLNGVEQGGRTNNDVSLTWDEIGATATIDKIAYTSGAIIDLEGLHQFILSDALGNQVVIDFEIDKTPPSYTLVGVSLGGITNQNVKLSWSESSATATLNGSNYTSGSYIAAEGNHEIILTDRIGNSVVIDFEIDKTPPTFTLEGVEQGGCTNQDVKLSWSEASAMASMDGNSISNPSVFTNDGLYEITLSDDVGNKVVVNFTIDKTPPSYTLIGVEQGGYTNKNVSLRWSESSAYATINGSPYANGETINNEGEYSINLYDAIGNMVLITFTIDKTPPAYSFSSTPTNFKNNTYYF